MPVVRSKPAWVSLLLSVSGVCGVDEVVCTVQMGADGPELRRWTSPRGTMAAARPAFWIHEPACK